MYEHCSNLHIMYKNALVCIKCLKSDNVHFLPHVIVLHNLRFVIKTEANKEMMGLCPQNDDGHCI